MGLANIQPTVVSNYMKENYMNEEEPEDLEGGEEAPMDMGAEEEPALDAAPQKTHFKGLRGICSMKVDEIRTDLRKSGKFGPWAHFIVDSLY